MYHTGDDQVKCYHRVWSKLIDPRKLRLASMVMMDSLIHNIIDSDLKRKEIIRVAALGFCGEQSGIPLYS